MTRRCSTCGINYPDALRFQKCRVCDEPTSYITNANPNPEWEDEVADRLRPAANASPEAKIEHNRMERFLAAGLDLDRAMVFAAARESDLHRFERLIKQGCDIETAARIVAPL